jgi:hypothetical protein
MGTGASGKRKCWSRRLRTDASVIGEQLGHRPPVVESWALSQWTVLRVYDDVPRTPRRHAQTSCVHGVHGNQSWHSYGTAVSPSF